MPCGGPVAGDCCAAELRTAEYWFLSLQGALFKVRNRPCASAFAGVVVVPWPALAAYMEQQREAMDKDHFFSAGMCCCQMQ